MTKLFGFFLTLALLAFNAPSQAQTPQQKPGARGPDFSDGQKKTKLGRLPRKSEIDYLESRLKRLLARNDTKVFGRKALWYELIVARKRMDELNKLNAGIGLRTTRPPAWWNALPSLSDALDEKDRKRYTKDPDRQTWPTLDYSFDAKSLMEKWIPKYKKYLRKKSGTMVTLTPDQLEQQVWHWLLPREKALRKARLKWAEKSFARNLKSIRETRAKLAKIKAKRKKTESAVDDEQMREKDIEKEKAKREETDTARREDGGAGRTPAKQAPTALACDALGGEWHGGTLANVRQIATAWKKEISSPCISVMPDTCRFSLGARSFQAYMKTLMIWQCHASFVRLSKKGSEEDRKLAREEGCAIEKTLEKMAEHIKATGTRTAGASWKPFHIAMSEKWELKDLCDTGKIEEAGSGSRKEPVTAGPIAEPKPKNDCKSSGGLAGAGNCVAKLIEGAGGSGAKTLGTPTASDISQDKAGAAGMIRDFHQTGNSPAWASSTDPKTGITIKSVANPDGSRTVTRTDKDGILLSKERVR